MFYFIPCMNELKGLILITSTTNPFNEKELKALCWLALPLAGFWSTDHRGKELLKVVPLVMQVNTKKIYFWHNLKAYHNILSSNEKLKQWESLSYSYWTQLIKAKKIIDYKSKLPNVHYFLLYQDIFTKWNQLLNIQFLSGDILL